HFRYRFTLTNSNFLFFLTGRTSFSYLSVSTPVLSEPRIPFFQPDSFRQRCADLTRISSRYLMGIFLNVRAIHVWSGCGSFFQGKLSDGTMFCMSRYVEPNTTIRMHIQTSFSQECTGFLPF